MRGLIATALFLCFVIACFGHGAAQDPNTWIEVSRSDDFFRVSMPIQPVEESQAPRFGPINAIGKWFESSAEGGNYALWTLIDRNYHPDRNIDEYLDSCADLIWEALLKPGRDKLPQDRRVRAAMTYVKEFPAKPIPGREYSFTIGELTGTIQFYVAGERIFILLAAHSPGSSAPAEKFFASFSTLPNLPMPQAANGEPATTAAPATTATPGAVDEYELVFSGRDVTQKARVIEKHEPTYTESARKYGVQGTVVLRAVFSKDSTVTNIAVVRKLPHGLTQMAVEAARSIKFLPASKDGRLVSMYMQLEYNFNLY